MTGGKKINYKNVQKRKKKRQELKRNKKGRMEKRIKVEKRWNKKN